MNWSKVFTKPVKIETFSKSINIEIYDDKKKTGTPKYFYLLTQQMICCMEPDSNYIGYPTIEQAVEAGKTAAKTWVKRFFGRK